MFEIPHLIRAWRGAGRVADLAERVAGRSRLAVWQRVLVQAPRLGTSEARGYLRARSVAVIREETDRLVEQEGALAGRLRDRIEAAALEMLIEMIMDQLHQRRLQQGARQAA